MRMMTKSSRLIVALALAGAGACGGGHSGEHAEPHAAGGGGEHPEPVADAALHNACVAMMHRERDCSEQFVPALVALRVRLDHPTGIAAQDAADHNALLTHAQEGFPLDSTDERIAATCTDTSRHPSDHTAGWVPEMNHCVAMTDCHEFVECDMHFTEERFSDRAAHEAAHPSSETGTARPTTAPTPTTTTTTTTTTTATPPPSSTAPAHH